MKKAGLLVSCFGAPFGLLSVGLYITHYAGLAVLAAAAGVSCALIGLALLLLAPPDGARPAARVPEADAVSQSCG